MAQHLDRKKVKRQGWFQKKEKGMPDPNYRATCTSGFLGARWDAHHLLPQTSIEKAVGQFKDPKRKYLSDVQYITNWVINNGGNMLGMPQFASFLFYYQAKEGLLAAQNPKLGTAGEGAKVKAYANTFNSVAKAARQKWLKDLPKQSPEGYPIHRPVNWGHTDYNDQVQADLKTKVWDPLDEKKKKHDVDAASVAGQLGGMSTSYRAKLKARGATTTHARWKKRYDKNDNAWFKPFTMTDVADNPLFG